MNNNKNNINTKIKELDIFMEKLKKKLGITKTSEAVEKTEETPLKKFIEDHSLEYKQKIHNEKEKLYEELKKMSQASTTPVSSNPNPEQPTNAANNENYSSILKKLESLKENMEKKVDKEFQERLDKAKPESIVTIYQIGGINFKSLIILFLIIQKLRDNNTNTEKLELYLKKLLDLRVIDKKSKNKPEELLKKYKAEINSKPIDVLKREFNEESKILFQYYTDTDESEIPKLEVKNNKSANQTVNQATINLPAANTTNTKEEEIIGLIKKLDKIFSIM